MSPYYEQYPHQLSYRQSTRAMLPNPIPKRALGSKPSLPYVCNPSSMAHHDEIKLRTGNPAGDPVFVAMIDRNNDIKGNEIGREDRDAVLHQT